MDDHGGPVTVTWVLPPPYAVGAPLRRSCILPSYQPAPKESKAELIAHCQLFIESYTKAAEEAEALAKLHREQDKAIP